MSEEAPAETLTRDKLLPIAQRGWLTLAQVPLVLPYVVVTKCGESSHSELTGIELFFSGDYAIFAFTLFSLLTVLAVFAWRGEMDGTVTITAGLRGFIAGFGGLIVMAGPGIAFLFDQAEMRVGWWAHVGAWTLTMLGYCGLGAVAVALGWGPPLDRSVPRSLLESGMTLLLLVITPLAVAINPFFNDAVIEDVPWLLAIGYSVALPLFVAGVGLARARQMGLSVLGYRILWWLASVITVGVHVVAAFSD